MDHLFSSSFRLAALWLALLAGALAAPADRIYVTSAEDSSVQEFDGTGAHLGAVLTRAGVPENRVITEPAGLSFDPAGSLWVTSAHSELVGKILPNGTAQIMIESGLTRPQGLCFGPTGELFVVNEGEGSSIHTVAKYNVSGSAPVLLATYGGPAGAPFQLPHQVTLGADGTAYVADVVAHTVSTIKSDGTMAVLFFYNDQAPIGVALDAAGLIYVSFYRSNEIRKYSHDGSIEYRRDAGGGQTLPFITTSFTTNPPDSFNRALTFDGEGNLFVPNQFTGTVQKFDPAGNLVLTFGGGHLHSPYAMAIRPAAGGPGAPTSPSIASEPGGGFRFNFRGTPGGNFTIQWTAALAPSDWQPLGTATANAQGSATFVDVPPPDVTQRFYRASAAP